MLTIINLFIAVTAFADTKKDCGPVPIGGSFDESCKIVLIPPPHINRKFEESLFYDLHQAIGYFEEFKKNRCPHGLVFSRKLLKDAATKRSYDAELSKIFKDANASAGNEKTGLAIIESLRERLHRLQEKKQYPHQNAWHKAFQSCIDNADGS